MADIKISELPAATAVVAGSDVAPLVSGGSTTKATPAQMVTAALNATPVTIAQGGTGATTRAAAATAILPDQSGQNGKVLGSNGSVASWVENTGGSVTEVTATAPLASSGGFTPDISLTGIVDVVNGGTGAATAADARVELNVPSTSGQNANGLWDISISGNAATASEAAFVTHNVIFDTTGGDLPGVSFDGEAAVAVDYSTVGAPAVDGTDATGTWDISILGNAATADLATNASHAAAADEAGHAVLADTADAVANAVTFNVAGGAAAGADFDGSVAITVDYSTVGAAGADGTGASGTWAIDISGNAATADDAAHASVADTLSVVLPIDLGGTNATTASDARDNLGLGTIAVQNANAVDITGGSADLDSGTVAATPIDPLDMANKDYVDSVAQGLDVKPSCQWGTVGNITLSGLGTQANGEWTGSLTAGQRILVKSQAAPQFNGIYVAAAGIWARSADCATWDALLGAYVYVADGATLAATGWCCTIAEGGTLDVTPVTWTQFSGAGTYKNGTGLSLVGNTFSISNTGVAASTYGDAATAVSLAINAQGQITTASASAIAIAATQVTSGVLAIANGGTNAGTAADARTSLDVPQTDGTGATGTWAIDISGNADTATNATTADSATFATDAGNAATATEATNALTADDLNTGAALETPASGDFSTGVFVWPTFNQDTTGNAATADLATEATHATAADTATTATSATTADTADDLNTGAALATPASGDFSTGTFTWPTFDQDTTGNAATADYATAAGTATSATSATNAATADDLNTGAALATPASGDFSTGTFTWPTFNQNTTGNADTATTADKVANALTFSETAVTFDGSAPVSVGYADVGAPAVDGADATGTWDISITGNAATADSATTATSATNAATADDLNTGAALATPASGDFSTGTFTWPTFNQSTSGNAATASVAAIATAFDTYDCTAALPAGTLGQNLVLTNCDAGLKTFGLTVAPTGTDTVMAWYNGTNWTITGV